MPLVKVGMVFDRENIRGLVAVLYRNLPTLRIPLDPSVSLLRYGDTYSAKLRYPHLTACVAWLDERLSFLKVPALKILRWKEKLRGRFLTNYALIAGHEGANYIHVIIIVDLTYSRNGLYFVLILYLRIILVLANTRL